MLIGHHFARRRYLIPGLIIVVILFLPWAILARDYPVILTVNFVSAVLVLTGTFISDLLYLVVDPRIRL